MNSTKINCRDTEKLNFTREELSSINMHSFLNILNVLAMQFSILKMETGNNEEIEVILSDIESMSEACKKNDIDRIHPNKVLEFQQEVWTLLQNIRTSESPSVDSYLNEMSSVMNETFKVMDVRVKELIDRLSDPFRWEYFSTEELRNDLDDFFHAVEKSSYGKFSIKNNIANKINNSDYLVHFDIDSLHKQRIQMPLIFKDVIRDLVANSRKYTDPGGRIDVGLSEKMSQLRLVVEDNGIGIPESEIDKVTDYGYRASNVQGKKTMGGGFGLTKALYITEKLKGNMWIASGESEGTKITIELPKDLSIGEN